MTEDEARLCAKSLTSWQREILLRCSERSPLKFNHYDKIGFAHREVEETGRVLASLGLATIKWVRDDMHDDGDGIWLNEHGEKVRQASLIVKESNAPNN